MADDILDKPDSLDQIKLLDEELKPKNKSCWFFHSWSDWEDFERGTISRGDITVGRYIYQERRCNRCGKVEMNQVKTYS